MHIGPKIIAKNQAQRDSEDTFDDSTRNMTSVCHVARKRTGDIAVILSPACHNALPLKSSAFSPYRLMIFSACFFLSSCSLSGANTETLSPKLKTHSRIFL